jgi:hypothetical protein
MLYDLNIVLQVIILKEITKIQVLPETLRT